MPSRNWDKQGMLPIMTDVFTTLGIFVGLLFVRFTGYLWLDGVVATIMAMIILYTGTKLVRQAFGGLLDESSPELLDEILSLLSRKRKDTWIDIHRLRAWRAGSQIRVDFHLVLPQDLRDLEYTKIPFIMSPHTQIGGIDYEDNDIESEWRIPTNSRFGCSFG